MGNFQKAVRQFARSTSLRRTAFAAVGLFALLGTRAPVGQAQTTTQMSVTVPPAPQTPSPMVENTRAHTRISSQKLDGVFRTFTGPLGKPVSVFIPANTRGDVSVNLIIHFHGDSSIPSLAALRLENNAVAVALTLGAGSGVYDRTFSSPPVFDTLVDSIWKVLSNEFKRPARVDFVTLSGFSAGHGAIRAILRDSMHFQQVDAVLLLDGMHTSYVPEGSVLEKGGELDPTNLMVWTDFARAAMRGEKSFLVTHSEIFPGTYASTTETADYLLAGLGLKRTPVLLWGPGGMQQLSSVKSGRFAVLGFAGNSAPDHIDHFHAMPEMLKALQK